MANHALQMDDESHDVEEVLIHIHYISASQPVNWSSYEVSQEGQSKRIVDHLDAQVGGKRIRMIVPDGLSSERIAVKIDSASPTTAVSGQRETTAVTTFTLKTLPWNDDNPHNKTASR
jgi:hypothetical protein